MPEYIDPPILTDPDDLAALAIAQIQAQFTEWVPAAGDLATILVEANARVAAVGANLAALVPKSIFRFLGQLFRILPIDATQASVASTWTVIDDAGYTIPAGTVVGIAAAGDNIEPFLVAEDVSIMSGDTSTGAGEVQLVALTPGLAGSGLGGIGVVAELQTIIDYVDVVTLTAVTAGGIDAEDDATYLNRLTTEIQLQTPRPILPGDFSALAQSVATVDRALTIDLYQPAINERQTVQVNATGGTFTLTFNGHVTTAIAFGASAATIQAALEALAGVGVGQISCSGGPVNVAAVTVEFTGSLGGTNVGAITQSSASLTGGTHTATITQVVTGAAAIVDQEATVTTVPIDTSGQSTAISAVKALLQSLREVGFIVNVIAPTYTEIDYSYTIGIAAGFTESDVLARADAAIASFGSPANWGLPSSGDRRIWRDTPTVRILDIAGVLRGVQGVQNVQSVEIAVHGGGLAATDIVMAGPAPLPTVGTITGTAA